MRHTEGERLSGLTELAPVLTKEDEDVAENEETDRPA